MGVQNAIFGSDLDLVEEEKARVLQALTMFGEELAHIRSSPEINAVQTASLVNETFKVDDGLAELNLGRWKGKALNTVAEAEPGNLQAWVTNPGVAPHGGETVNALIERAGQWLDGQLSSGGKHVAIVNQSMIRAMVLAIMKAPAHSFWCLDIAPLSKTEISADGRRWSIRTMGAAISTNF